MLPALLASTFPSLELHQSWSAQHAPQVPQCCLSSSVLLAHLARSRLQVRQRALRVKQMQTPQLAARPVSAMQDTQGRREGAQHAMEGLSSLHLVIHRVIYVGRVPILQTRVLLLLRRV